MSIVNYYFKDSLNVGDINSAPLLYFKPKTEEIILEDITRRREFGAKANIIGGGAILNKVIRKSIKFKNYSIIWGGGYTERNVFRRSVYNLNHIDLIGVRDYNSKYRWVPCSSCMSALFDKKYDICRETVVYENSLHGRLLNADLGNDSTDMETVIEYLASAEVVITSSYHGAYWATLLGRKVVAIPFGSKFYSFKHMPVTCAFEDVRNHIKKAVVYQEALEECRKANKDYASRVEVLLSTELIHT